MELKEFTKKAILEIVEAVEEARGESKRDMRLKSTDKTRTIEFDIAVSAEESEGKEKKAGIKVWQFLEGGASSSDAIKNATITRIKFGVFIEEMTREEEEKFRRGLDEYNSNPLQE